MLNINFVPDDYVQSNESRRTNLIYLVLLAVVMAALGSSFITIRIRQRAIRNKENLVNAKMAQIQEVILQFEQLQERRRAMMKTALTTAELIEPVPRSVLLASLTNNLPPGVSLLKLRLIQKQIPQSKPTAVTSKYQAAQANKVTPSESSISPERMLETHIYIEGVAPSDLQVAAYIKRLSASNGLLENVALVESKEHPIEGVTFRQFKLTAMLGKEIHLTKDDVDRIRTKAVNAVWNF